MCKLWPLYLVCCKIVTPTSPVWFTIWSALCVLLKITICEGFKCPPSTEISPCECYPHGLVGCWFQEKVTQETVNNLFAKLRSENGISTSEIFHFPQTGEFTLRDSDITELDLTPLANMSMYRIFLDGNTDLTRIKNPPLSSNRDSISISWLSFLDYSIDDIGLGQTLKYFNPQSLKLLHLLHNNLSGSAEGKLWSGFWNFVNLEEIRLDGNPIKKITRKQFAAFPQLSILNLSFGLSNALQFEKDAFTMHSQYNEINSGKKLTVDLSNNNLDHHSFNLREYGLFNYPNVTIDLHLNFNKFETLLQEDFEPFLEINDRNTISVSGNPLKCNAGTLKWLQHSKQWNEERVISAFCDGDGYGCTIFQATSAIHPCRLKLQRIKDYLTTLATVIALTVG